VPTSGEFAVPLQAPDEIAPESGLQAGVSDGVEGGVEGGVPGGLMGGVVGGLPTEVPPPPPLPPPVPTRSSPVRVGGEIQAPALLTRVNPKYSTALQMARVEGLVILEATVDSQGIVESVKVLRSAGMLDEPAVEAVRQWRYSPLTLNGRPTPFILTVTVAFVLDKQPGRATD
jgi:protein TonB